LKPGNGSPSACRLGDGVADLRVGDALDVGDDEADLADAELVDGHRLRREDADLLDLVVLRRRPSADLHARRIVPSMTRTRR
jgi:hypothetical protein